MEVYEELRESINEISEEAINKIPQDYRKHKIGIYRTGFIERIDDTNYAIDYLRLLKEDYLLSEEGVMPTLEREYSYENKIYFYSDSFWAFLYSGLDIFSQLVNQIMDLGLDEENVSFKRVWNHLENQNPTPDLFDNFDTIKRSIAFINLEKYRHCLTHRRSIAIDITQRSRLGGYQLASTSTGDQDLTSTVTFYTCDNPNSLTNPKFDQERKIPNYLIDKQSSIFSNLITAIDNIEIR